MDAENRSDISHSQSMTPIEHTQAPVAKLQDLKNSDHEFDLVDEYSGIQSCRESELWFDPMYNLES